MFKYFCLNYFDKNNHIERIPVAVKNIDHLFRMANKIIESDNLHPGLPTHRGLSGACHPPHPHTTTHTHTQTHTLFFVAKRKRGNKVNLINVLPSQSWWPTILFSVPWPLHFKIHIAGHDVRTQCVIMTLAGGKAAIMTL